MGRFAIDSDSAIPLAVSCSISAKAPLTFDGIREVACWIIWLEEKPDRTKLAN